MDFLNIGSEICRRSLSQIYFLRCYRPENESRQPKFHAKFNRNLNSTHHLCSKKHGEPSNKENIFCGIFRCWLQPVSSNINEVIRVFLKSFYKEFLHAQKSIKNKQATFTQIFFYTRKKHKKHKKHKRQTSDFLLLRCFLCE